MAHHLGHTPHVHEHSDEWHHHSQAEGVPQHEHAAIASAATLTKWFLGMAITVTVVVAVLRIYYTTYTTHLKAELFETTAAVSMRADAAAAKTAALEKELKEGDRISKSMDTIVQQYKSRK